MPYETVWATPELLLEHAGVKVFHAYKDDDIEQGRSTYMYSLSDVDDEYQFDVRDFDSNHLLDAHPPYLQGANDTPENREAWRRWHAAGQPDAIRAIVIASIDAGLIKKPEDA